MGSSIKEPEAESFQGSELNTQLLPRPSIIANVEPDRNPVVVLNGISSLPSIIDYKEPTRNLIVVLDGTSNQFGMKNSHCVEVYSHLEKSAAQLTYYNSGIGTYIDPNAYGPFVKWRELCNLVDLGIAYRLRSYILGAYRWLSVHYRSGDRIFLYGFSRGAYEVRALAAMINKVGLIHAGNEEQIPFAYDLYADPNSRDLAIVFKQCFSRDVVHIHFVGVWDTVSSAGLFRDLVLPGIQDSSHIVTIRHAVSLDECRVKFQPQLYLADGPVAHSDLKEVWFAGTHSDVGGGNRPNPQLILGAVPLLWMEWESLKAGVHLKADALKIWDLKALPIQRPIPSLQGVRGWARLYWVMESWHWGRGRTIPSSHKLHISILFKLSEDLWKASWGDAHPEDRDKPPPKFVPYAPKAIRPAPQDWESLGSISSDHLGGFRIHADLDVSVELDLFDDSESQLDYLVTQTANAHCHPSLRSTACVRLIYIATQSAAARDRFDECLIEATFNLLEQQDTRLDRAPLYVLWYLTGHPGARQHLLSDRFLGRASDWINTDDFELTWAGLSLVRELLQGSWSYTRNQGPNPSQRFENISLPQPIITGILRRWSEPNLSDNVIQICAQHVIIMLWRQNTERTQLLTAGLIEKGFDVACQWTITQTAALNMLRSFMEDGNAREHVSPEHHQRIVQLLQTGPPEPDDLWERYGQQRARQLLSCLPQNTSSCP